MWTITLTMKININAHTHTCVCRHTIKNKKINTHKRNKEKGESILTSYFAINEMTSYFLFLSIRLYWYGKYSVPNVFNIQSYFEMQYGVLLYVLTTIHMKRNTNTQKGIQRDREREREERVLHLHNCFSLKSP